MYTNFIYGKTTLTDNKVAKKPKEPVLDLADIQRGLRSWTTKRVYPARNDERRADWDRNHLKVKNMIREFIKQGGRFNNWEIAVATGLSECTVKKHVREIDVEELYFRYRVRHSKASMKIIRGAADKMQAGSFNSLLHLSTMLGLDSTDRRLRTKWDRREIGSIQRYVVNVEKEAQLNEWALEMWLEL